MSYKYLDLTGLSHFWDKIKAKFDSFSRNDLAILNSKEYSGIYGSANDQAGASFYFGTIRPTNWYDMWKIRFRVYASVPNQNNYRQYSDVTFYGNQTEVTYKIENKMYSTGNRCYYYVNLCKLNATGYNAGYSYIPGINLRSSNNPTSSSYPRTFKIEILETEKCTFTFYDSMKKVANISEYSTTNYAGISEYDGANNGLRETGDDTNIWQLRHNSGNYVVSTALYRYMLLLQKNETTLIPMNAVNNSTATTKTLTTEEFDPFGQILYYNSTNTVNANASVGAGTLFEQIALDLRYSFNTGTTLTAHRDVYMVAVPQPNGKAKLHTSPITHTLPSTEDGLIYIYLGRAYSTYQIEIHPVHPIYEYKGGFLKLYINDFASNYSREIQSGTIDDLINRLYGKAGLTGSISLTAKSSGTGSEIPAGWYNFYFAPHRTGMTWNNSDNGNYGTIILTPMNFSGKSWIIRRGYSNGSPVVSEVKSIATGDLANYVTLSTAQTISGNKTHSGTITMNNVNNINYSTSTTSNIIPSSTGLANPPWNKDLWHDHFAFLRNHTIQSQETTTDGETWTTASKSINTLFYQKDATVTRILNASELGYRFTLKNTNFAYSGVSWFELGVSYSNPFSNFTVLIEFSSDAETWTTIHQSTIASNSAPFFLKNNTSFTADGYIRFTFTKTTNTTTGLVNLTCIKALCTRKGDQGMGSEYEYPYDWDTNANLLPIANTTNNLGDSSRKWNVVYATTFNGNATSATKATGDKNGADITTTYYKASNPNGYTSNTGTITGVSVNGTSIASSGVANLVTNTAYNSSTNKIATMADVSSSGDYIIEFPSSWSSVIDEYDQAGSPDYFSVDILANTYSGIGSDHEHYFVNADLYNAIDRIIQGDIAEVKLNLNNTTYGNDYYVSSAYVSANGSDELDVKFGDNAYVVSQDLGSLSISGKYITRSFPYYTISCGQTDFTYFYNNAEFTNNKVTSISSSSTNTQYPSALAVYNYVNSAGGGITIDDVYPVGSIYMSVNNTNPSTLFGGTWEQLKDRFLLGAGDTYTAGATGGEATHQLTKAELPAYDLYNASHSHQIKSYSGYSGSSNNPGSAAGTNQGTKTGSTEGTTIKVSSGGSNQAHNNMPPYLVVYMWKRTA